MGIGMRSVEKAVERAANKGGGGGTFLSGIFWQDDKAKGGTDYRKIIRFLTEDVITAEVYEFVKGGSKNIGIDWFAVETLRDDDGNRLWPEELANERDYIKTNDIWLPDYKGNLKSPKDYAKERSFGLAVVRDVVTEIVDGKRRVKVVDLESEREWEDSDGNKKSEKGLQFGYIKQAYKNFWATLVGYYGRYDSICDRDYEIIRSGSGTDTTYIIMPMDRDAAPDLIPKDGQTQMEVLRERYFAKTPEERTPYHCPMELKDWVISRSKYDECARWLEGKHAPVKDQEQQQPKDSPGGLDEFKSPEQAATVTEIRQPAQGKSLREELEGYARTT